MSWLEKYITISNLRHRIRCLEENNTNLHKRRTQLIKDVNIWHGKFMMVKEENNALRKKIMKEIKDDNS